MTVYVKCECSYTEGCCGVRQLSDFSAVYNASHDTRWAYFKSSADTPEEAYKLLFDQIRAYDFSDDSNDYSCSVLQIWFVKRKDFAGNYNAEYEAAPLKRLVEAIPNVVNLGEYLNPNSGNYIQGYQWAV